MSSDSINEYLDRALRSRAPNPATVVSARQAQMAPQEQQNPQTSQYSPRYALQSSYDTRSVLGVYDTSYYGYDLRFPLNTPNLTAQSITFSTSTFGRNADETFTPTTAGSVTYQTLLVDPDRLISNIDQGFICHLGNNTAFNQNYLIHADMTAVTHQIRLCFAVGLNVSAYTSGNFALSSVDISVQAFQNSQQPAMNSIPYTTHLSPQSAFSNLTAPGTQIMIIRADVDLSFLAYEQQPITINITVNETTGTGTRQVGLVPLFPLFATAGNKDFYESTAQVHIHPVPQHISTLRPFIGDWIINGFGNGGAGIR